MTRSDASTPILSSIAALAGTSDAWICDIWGVMHNGVRAFAPAVEACRAFRKRGGTVVLVSNAPRPFGSVARQIEGLGVTSDAYDGIVSSGDVTRDLLGPWQGRPLLHIGPERDRPVFEGLDIRFAAEADAEVVALTGLYDDTREAPGDYAVLFNRLLRRNVPVICANPDLQVERGAVLVYCAGALAELYGSLGGTVVYAGKPHLPIYDTAFAMIERVRGQPVPRERILAIGDGLRTDMDGAHAARLRPVFIASALHVQGPLDAARIGTLFSDRSYRPVAAQASLAW